MKILDKWETKSIGCIGYTVDDGNRNSGPYYLYAICKFKEREDAEDHIRICNWFEADRNMDIYKLFYDPTDVDNHPWIVCSWTKSEVA